MKKIATVLLSLMAISTAQAGTLLESSNKYTIDTATCTLLNENVKIALSSNVQGAFKCDDATSPTGIAIATCHTGGRTSSRAYTCTAADVTAKTPGCTAEGPTTQKGPVIAVASSLAPSVSSFFPGGGTCDSAVTGAPDTKLTADQASLQ